jgi:predicted alpha/beta superfamily hydrolase
MRYSSALLFVVLGFWVAKGDDSAPGPLTPQTASTPILTPGEVQVEFTSKFTHHAYRLMISAPPVADATKLRPVLYIMDGYWYFRPAVGYAFEAGGSFGDPIIVGIGYPTDDTTKEYNQRRNIDLSILPPASAKQPPPDKMPVGDDYLRMLDEEVKPYIEAHYPVDKTQQVLYGKSLGGLMVLRQLFRDPDASRFTSRRVPRFITARTQCCRMRRRFPSACVRGK